MAEQHQADVARSRWERRRGIARTVIGVLLTLLIGDLLCSLLVPFVGLLQIVLLKNLFFPQPALPDAVMPFSSAITVWNGHIYVGGTLSNTGIYDIQSGKLLSTIPDIVVGHDAQFLYTNTGTIAPNRTGFSSTFTARDSDGKAIWSYEEAPFALAAIQRYESHPQFQADADSVYLMEVHRQTLPIMSKVVALNRATGAVRWSYTTPYAVQFVIAQGALILLTQQQQPTLTAVIAFSTRDGRQLWRQTIPSANLFTDGRSVFLPTANGLRALSARTGAQAWTIAYHPFNFVEAPLLFADSVVYLLDASNQIIALDTSNGRERWRASGGAGTAEEPLIPVSLLAVQNGVLYTREDAPARLLRAVSASSGRTLWTAPLTVSALTFLDASGTMLYLTTCARASLPCTLVAVDEQTGRLIWSQKESAIGSHSARVLGEALYIASRVHRSQVSKTMSGRTIYGPRCSDTTIITRRSATTGAVEWRQATPFNCISTSTPFG